MLLDWWLGTEGIAYLRERDVRSLVARAAVSGGDIGKLEATGVQNFLDLDDLRVTEEGEPVHAQSIISLPLTSGRCVLPAFKPSPDDPFFNGSTPPAKRGSSWPVSGGNPRSCWTPTLSCLTPWSSRSTRIGAGAGTGRSSYGICRRGWATSLDA